MKEIVIIGAGFSGLAAAYYLAKRGAKVRILDKAGVGGGASGVAVGLLHPFAGRASKLNPGAMEAIHETVQLLEDASKALGFPVFEKTGQLRLMITEEQRADFTRCAKENAGVKILSAAECQRLVPALAPHPGIFIEEAYLVNCQAYLSGLHIILEKMGVTFEKKQVHSLDDFAGSIVVLATGIDTNDFENVKLTPIKGQVLRLKWPQKLPPLPFPINSFAYAVMEKDKKSCWVGATFERTFSSREPDLKTALKEIMPHASAMIPELAEAEVLEIQAGIRASGPAHLPIAMQVAENRYAIAGMGSKGLLFHALYAKKLSGLL